MSRWQTVPLLRQDRRVPRRPAYRAHLAAVPLFAGLSQKQIALIDSHADKVTVAAGTALCTEGELGQQYFLIVEGTAVVTRKGRKVATLGTGDGFGELSGRFQKTV